MNQATSNQRIKTATKDHARISRLHLKLHRGFIASVIVILLCLGLFTLVVVGIARPNVESWWRVAWLEKGPGCS